MECLALRESQIFIEQRLEAGSDAEAQAQTQTQTQAQTQTQTQAQAQAEAQAQEILFLVFHFRRIDGTGDGCDSSCGACHRLHAEKVISAIRRREPISFVLPAFPGKSPNQAKVLGPLPDMAEQLALQFLQRLCDRIKSIYSPGAKIVLCSDGRVFSDVVGMRDQDVTDYQNVLNELISQRGLRGLSVFNLDEVGGVQNFKETRQRLMSQFGVAQEVLREKVFRGSLATSSREEREAHRMFCGITRFLAEDANFPGQTKSRTMIQKESKAKAYEVIRRSNAWSELIACQFPKAVRLSIHPQGCGSKKIGLRLIGSESWITPWHGVALKAGGEYRLVKRSEAESLGATVVYASNGLASHFELSDSPIQRPVSLGGEK